MLNYQENKRLIPSDHAVKNSWFVVIIVLNISHHVTAITPLPHQVKRFISKHMLLCK